MVVDIFGRARKRKYSGEVKPAAAGVRGAPGARGPAGRDGVGFALTETGNFDIQSKRLTNLSPPLDQHDAVTKLFLEEKCLTRSPDGDFNAGDSRVTRVGEPTHDEDAVNRKWITDRIHFDKSYYSFKKRRLVSVGEPKDSTDVVTVNYLNLHTLKANSEGQFDAMGRKIVKMADPKPGTHDGVTCLYMEKNALVLQGDTFDAKSNRIRNLARPRAGNEAVTLEYFEDKGLCLNTSQKDDGTVESYWEGSDLRIRNLGEPQEETDAVSEIYLKNAIKEALRVLAVRIRQEIADLSIDIHRMFYNLKDTQKDKRVLASHLNSIEESIDRNWRAVHQTPNSGKKHSKEDIKNTKIVPEFYDE